mmetsp:Transcript_13719/g.28936  ORF Transcript_13719/g.28936 Transcript_13719/m.28936 type:complete len:152 (+) Transcript_13719:739-1194(+)
MAAKPSESTDDASAAATDTPAEHDGEITFNPPLGKMPPFTFMHPVLHGASERWKNGGGVNGLLGILRDGEDNAKALRTLVRFTLLMMAVPAAVMCACNLFVLDHFFSFSSAGDRMLYSGVAAIVAVQFVIGAFLFTAFTEPIEATADKKTR